MTIRATRPPRPRAKPETGAVATPGALVAVKRVFEAEGANYFLLLGTTLFLVILGLVMVLSSSAVESNTQDGGFFAVFLKQGMFALIGVPLMLVASRLPARFWKRMAWPALIAGAAFQLLVFSPLGVNDGGNQNWIRIGGFSAQPSEFVKLALVLWVAWVLTTKQNLLHDWKHVLVPVAPVAAVAIGLVLVGNDLGTAIIMLLIVLGSLFYAGVRWRIIGTSILLVGVVAGSFAALSSSRSHRISAWVGGCSDPKLFLNECNQAVHGWWALASGGVFGAGLGSSREKWKWLPAADSDFIFSIIGNELGLIGAVVVLVLFVVLAVGFIRIIRTSRDPFARVATSGVMIWLIGQAFVNIAVVLGILPVFGVPLPLISAGGSALITSLLAIGVVLSFARQGEVDRRAALEEPYRLQGERAESARHR